MCVGVCVCVCVWIFPPIASAATFLRKCKQAKDIGVFNRLHRYIYSFSPILPGPQKKIPQLQVRAGRGVRRSARAAARIVRRKGIDGAAVIRTKVTEMMTGHGDDPVMDHGDDELVIMAVITAVITAIITAMFTGGRLSEFLMF